MGQKEIILPELVERKRELEKTIKKAEQILSKKADGYLQVNRHDGHYRYYMKEDQEAGQENRKRKYIKDINIAKAIANRDYAKQIIKSASHELKQVDTLIKTYSQTTADECYKRLHPGRQILVTPLIADDEQYAKSWLAIPAQERNSYPAASSILTENNEMVRSKSEKIIADKLKLSGIPYVYEKPLKLGTITKYPDFTALNKRTRKEYYWEHMGMMDSPDYFKEAMEKIELYQRYGIVPGKNLIITYETDRQPLSVKSVEIFIKEYLL